MPHMGYYDKPVEEVSFYQKLWGLRLKVENFFITGSQQRNKVPVTIPIMMSVVMIGKVPHLPLKTRDLRLLFQLKVITFQMLC